MSVVAALDAPDDQGNPKSELEDDTKSDTGEASIPECAFGIAIGICDVVIEVVQVGAGSRLALILCILACPGTKETTADNEEDDGEAEAQDGPALAEGGFCLDDFFLVCHVCGV